jgi:cytochrome P450
MREVKRWSTHRSLSSRYDRPLLEQAARRHDSDAISDLSEVFSSWSVMLDGEPHQRYRRLLQRALTSNDIVAGVERVHSEAARLVRDALRNGHFDPVEDFAAPLVGGIVAELLGLTQGHWRSVRAWSEAFAALLANPLRTEAVSDVISAVWAINTAVINAARESPSSLAGTLVTEGFHLGLSQSQTTNAITMVVLAAFEAPTYTLGNVILRLAGDNTTYDRIKGEHTLIDSAVEELLRLETSVLQVPRLVEHACRIDGFELPDQRLALLMLGAANRDRMFYGDGSDVVNFDRRRYQHVTFGHGVHFCLGAPIMRRLLTSVLEVFINSSFDLWPLSSPSWHRRAGYRHLKPVAIAIRPSISGLAG